MDFAYSDDQEAWRRTLRSFFSQHAPVAASREASASVVGYDPTVWRRMGELGVHGIHVEERFGGQGFGVEELAIVVEEFGRALVCAPYVASTVLAATALRGVVARSSDGRAAELLRSVASGERIATVALWQAEGEWDPFAGEVPVAETGPGGDAHAAEAGPVATAGADEVTLRGTKIAVPFATAAQTLLVTAVRDGVPVLAAVDSGAAGVERTDTRGLDLTTRLCTVRFTNARAIPLVWGDAARDVVAETLRYAYVLAAAQMVGAAGACLDAALAYAKQRHQFGRPIGSFQAIKHLLADMLAELELARSASLYAVWALRSGDAAVDRAASMAKALASDAYLFVADASLHIHGGLGFTWEHDAHLYLRHARAMSLLYGDSARHADLFLAHTDRPEFAEALSAARPKGSA